MSNKFQNKLEILQSGVASKHQMEGFEIKFNEASKVVQSAENANFS